jgi:antitoxin YefM
MHTISYTQARNDLASTMNKVIEDHIPIKVTRGNDKRVIIISEEDYDSMVETCYLFSSPNNAKRLLEAMKEIEDRIDSEEK